MILFSMRVLVFCFLLGLLTFPVDAQTIWSRPYEPNQFAVETIVPDAPDDAALLSGATFLTGTISLNDNIEVAAEMPIARYAPTNSGASITAAGNPYVGVGFSSTRIPLLLQLGARLPAAPSNAATRIGQISDVGRTSAFRHDEFILSGLLNGRRSIGRHSTLRVRAGLGYATYPTPATIDQGRKRDWRMYYDAQIWREGDPFVTGLSFTGRATLTHSKNTQHHAAVSMMTNWRRVQPGLVVGTSLNALVQESEFVPFVGLTLSFTYMR